MVRQNMLKKHRQDYWAKNKTPHGGLGEKYV